MSRLAVTGLMASVLVAATALLAAQTPATSSATSRSQELAKAWEALASGRAADAERASDALLKATPRNHDALSLKIRASLATTGSTGALNAYEKWLAAVRQREDVFLLETIAIGIADELVASTDPGVRARALALLVAIGDRKASEQLNSATSAGSSASDVSLARLGDAGAVSRLQSRITEGGGRDVSDAIDALRDGNVKSASTSVAQALDPARPLPTRMAAARALGQIGDSSAIPALRAALKDSDPPVRILAASSLMRLGDQSGAELMQRIENSPVGDLRLLAVEASAPGNPSGPWTTVASGVLNDPDPLVRLRAAELLLQHASDPGAARRVLTEALTDPNPAMRYAAAARLDQLPPARLEAEIPALRRLLRDASPAVRIEGAAGILRISGALP